MWARTVALLALERSLWKGGRSEWGVVEVEGVKGWAGLAWVEGSRILIEVADALVLEVGEGSVDAAVELGRCAL